MNKGTIKWFNWQKGFGFISDESGDDIFLHASQVKKEDMWSMEEGQPVQYEVTRGARGPQAVNVKRL